ncbi:hypothetical protein J8TS2_35650 [Lederbergia ruris]|uniref:Phage tail tape measure protein domain-containing protein n=1 Tax=Lederbergia ruris TaxID=217495 RepID=A0ABQ4KP35_9BACI|nr:phage tail tape measure protein [Lederbergia ruris]GIN59246.1 hypothetical protein J8TS2_35650 [Lederbergia ruris]
MAKQLGVKLVSNSSQFKSDMGALSRQLKALKGELQANANETDKYGNKLQNNEAKVKILTRQLDVHRQKVKQLKMAYQDSANQTGKNSKETQNLEARLHKATAEMNKAEGELKRLKSTMANVANVTKKTKMSFKEFDQSFRNIGSNMRNVGLGVSLGAGAAFAGLVKPIKEAVAVSMEFDAGMSEVSAISGATGKELDKLRKEAKRLGETTVFSASQSAEGMKYLALAGWKTNDILAGMPGMLDLAAAGNLDLARAADITSDTMQAFGLKANKATHAADVFAYAQANANTNVEQLGEGMEYLAPVANTLGWELEESSAALMAFADSGIKGSKGGQAFATSLGRLAKPTSAMKKEMKKLGMAFFDAEGNMKPLPKVVAEIEKGTKGMTREQKSAVLTTLFGAQAYKHWAILLEQGSDELERTTKELKNADGAAKDMAKTMLDNAQGDIVLFKSAIEGLQISLAEKLTPAFRDVIQQGTELIDGFNGLDDATKETIAKTSLLGAGILGTVTAVGALTASIGALMAFAGPVGLAIVGGTALLGGLALAIYANETKTKALKKEQEKARVEALIYGEGLSEGTREGVKGYVDLYEGAKVKMYELKNMSGEEAQKTSAEIVKAFGEMGDQVVSTLEDQKTKIAKAIYSIYEVAGEAGVDAARETTKKAMELIDEDIARYKEAVDTIADIHKEYKGDLSQLPDDVAKAYQEALKVMSQGSTAFASTQEEMRNLQRKIAETNGQVMYEEAQKFYSNVNEQYKNAVQAANEFYQENKAILDKQLAMYPEFEGEYNKLVTGLQASTDSMIYEATISYNKSLGILSDNLDARGKLIDIATGKEFEKQFKLVESVTGAREKVQETDLEHYMRWVEYTQDTLKRTEDFSKRTKDVYQKQLEQFLIASGKTKEDAKKISKQLVDESLAELGKGDEKAKKAGKDKGEAHKKGIEETKGANKKAGADVTNETDKELNKKKDSASKAGKDKGNAHKQGLSSTQSSNTSTASLLGSAVTGVLAKTTDGGGGRKAGSLFKGGLGGQASAVRSTAYMVANRGLSGLKSVNTSGAGSMFVAGFRGSISSGSGSVWSAAWSLGRQALSALRSSIKTASPSKETAITGEWFTQGFAIGIDDEAKTAVKSAVSMAKDTTEAFRKEIDSAPLNVSLAAKEISNNRDVLTVLHEIGSSKLEDRLAMLEDGISKLTDVMTNLMSIQSEQMIAIANTPPVLELNGYVVSKALKDDMTKAQKRDQYTKNRRPKGGVR